MTWKWILEYPDQLWNHIEMWECRQQRHRWKFLQYWIKEVEMVDSLDDSKSSCSVKGIHMPNFEVLDARIASALNRIMDDSRFKRRVSVEEQKAKRGPFPLWKTDRLPDLRVLPGHWGQRFCRGSYLLSFFEVTIFRSSIQNGMEFCCP